MAGGWRLLSADKTVRLWDAETVAQQQAFKGHMEGVRSVAFSPNGQRLASASGNITVCLWDTETGAQQQTLQGPYILGQLSGLRP